MIQVIQRKNNIKVYKNDQPANLLCTGSSRIGDTMQIRKKLYQSKDLHNGTDIRCYNTKMLLLNRADKYFGSTNGLLQVSQVLTILIHNV